MGADADALDLGVEVATCWLRVRTACCRAGSIDGEVRVLNQSNRCSGADLLRVVSVSAPSMKLSIFYAQR